MDDIGHSGDDSTVYRTDADVRTTLTSGYMPFLIGLFCGSLSTLILIYAAFKIVDLCVGG
jgi:hypothetical protein